MKLGIDLFKRALPRRFRNSRAGLLVHPASVGRALRHSVDIIRESKVVRVSTLFGPQHGIWGETQDNMIEWRSFKEPSTGLPIRSLYGKVRKPTPHMLRDIDVLIIDLQDVGSRYYTFIWTMALCMEASMESSKGVIVLDRPNPIGGHIIEGPILKEGFESFVGLRPIPVRHSMTIAEIAIYLKEEFYPSLDLEVIPMSGWRRRLWFDETGLYWVMPSPNMPTLDTAAVYPGMCLLEGTNLSEGRGTTRPFEIFGAPFGEPQKIVKRLNEFRLPGVIFRAIYFKPTFQKHSKRLCGGAQIHVIDRERFKPFKTAVSIIKTFYELYPNEFRWKSPPYEYEYEKPPIDILYGSDELRNGIERGLNIEHLEECWKKDCLRFKKVIEKYLLYE